MRKYLVGLFAKPPAATCKSGGVIGIGHKFRRADRLGTTFPDPSARCGDVAVRVPENAGRTVVPAYLATFFSIGQRAA
jgi:hypothetical protein